MATEPVLTCTGIRRAYLTDGELVWALWDVDVSARPGELTVLAGPSGSGKSTLLRVMAGIDLPDQGRVVVAGTELTTLSPRARRRFRARNIGYVFQDPAANLLAYLTVWEHMAMAGRIRAAVPRDDLLETLEIADLAAVRPGVLSAGQQQRAALATAATGSPRVLLADEPTAELDTESARLAVDALRRLTDTGATLVVASHDPEVIGVSDRVVRLEYGMVRE